MVYADPAVDVAVATEAPDDVVDDEDKDFFGALICFAVQTLPFATAVVRLDLR